MGDAVLWIQHHRKHITDASRIEEHIFDDNLVACPILGRPSCPTCISFSAMSKLHKVCSHPSLLQVDQSAQGIEMEKKLEFAKVALTMDILRESPSNSTLLLFSHADSSLNAVVMHIAIPKANCLGGPYIRRMVS